MTAEQRALKKEANLRWRANNADKVTAYQKAYNEANRDLVRSRVSDWKRRNPDKRREYEARRYALKRGTRAGRISYEAIRKAAKGLCGICRFDIRVYDAVEFDHIIPLARGGTHTQGNIQLAHADCNRRKWARTESPRKVA